MWNTRRQSGQVRETAPFRRPLLHSVDAGSTVGGGGIEVVVSGGMRARSGGKVVDARRCFLEVSLGSISLRWWGFLDVVAAAVAAVVTVVVGDAVACG